MHLAQAEADHGTMLRELLDREEIKELRARYCWHVTRAEARQIADLYVEDGSFEVPGKPDRLRFAGRETIYGMLRGLTPGKQLPVVANHVIEISGDTATGTCAMHNLSLMEDGQRQQLVGCYHDSFRREAGRWRFVERRWYQYLPDFDL